MSSRVEVAKPSYGVVGLDGEPRHTMEQRNTFFALVYQGLDPRDSQLGGKLLVHLW